MTDERIKQMWLEGQRDELATLLRGIAISAAEKLYRQSMRGTETELDDVISWALESLWNAIKSWDPETKIPLRGWVAFKVPKDVIDVQRRTQRKKRGGGWDRIPLDTLKDSDISRTRREEEDAAVVALDAEKAMASLSETHRQIVAGLAAGASLSEIGKEVGMSKQGVQKAAKRIRERLA